MLSAQLFVCELQGLKRGCLFAICLFVVCPAPLLDCFEVRLLSLFVCCTNPFSRNVCCFSRCCGPLTPCSVSFFVRLFSFLAVVAGRLRISLTGLRPCAWQQLCKVDEHRFCLSAPGSFGHEEFHSVPPQIRLPRRETRDVLQSCCSHIHQQ